MSMYFFHTVAAAQEGPGIVIAHMHPSQDVELLCTVTGVIPNRRVNGVSYTLGRGGWGGRTGG